MFKQARRIVFSMLFLETEGRCWCKIQPRGMQWKCDRQKNKKRKTHHSPSEHCNQWRIQGGQVGSSPPYRLGHHGAPPRIFCAINGGRGCSGLQELEEEEASAPLYFIPGSAQYCNHATCIAATMAWPVQRRMTKIHQACDREGLTLRVLLERVVVGLSQLGVSAAALPRSVGRGGARQLAVLALAWRVQCLVAGVFIGRPMES